MRSPFSPGKNEKPLSSFCVRGRGGRTNQHGCGPHCGHLVAYQVRPLPVAFFLALPLMLSRGEPRDIMIVIQRFVTNLYNDYSSRGQQNPHQNQDGTVFSKLHAPAVKTWALTTTTLGGEHEPTNTKRG
jgi:hypothetical protein